MSDKRDTDPDDTMAAEYALGLLEGVELREAAQRAASNPAFAREVSGWRGRLAPLHAEVDEAAPPAALWSALERRIGTGAANDNPAVLRRTLNMWRSAAAAMTAIAAGLALFLVTQPRPSAAPQAPAQLTAAVPMVAMLGSDSSVKVVASWDPAARQLVLAIPGDLRADPSRSHELWVIPQGGKPRSLGLLPGGRQMHMRLAEALARMLQQGATVAISVEPRGGSATGAPTGPVVAAGTLSRA